MLVLDQILRFCVPLFVALSGYSLALRYNTGKIDLKTFFKKRIFKILPPYLFWSLVAYLSIILFQAWPGYQQNYPWWQIIFLGKADYHLYFVPMIIQLYLLFPLLLKLVKKYQAKFLVIIFALQLVWLWYVQQHIQPFKGNFWCDQGQYILFSSWLGYFVLGIYLAIKKHTQNKIWGLMGSSALPAGLILSITNSWQLFDKTGDVILATRFNRPEVFLYACGLIVFSLFFGQKLRSLPQRIFLPLEKLGQWSYEIYLIHTLPLRFLLDVKKFSPLYHPEIQNAFILGCSLLFAWFYKQGERLVLHMNFMKPDFSWAGEHKNNDVS